MKSSQHRSNSLTDKTVKGIHSQTVIVAIKGVLSLSYFSIMSRLLTPDDFGYFALIAAVTTVLYSLSEAGLGSSVIQKSEINRDFASTAFTLSLSLGIFFSVALFVLAQPLSYLVCNSDILTIAFRIMSSTIFIQAANNVTWALYMRKLDFFRFGILQVTADFLSYIVGIYFAIEGYGFYAIIAAGVANQVFLSFILLILKKYQFRIVIIKSYVREIIGYSGWLTASVILRNLTNEIDKVIIGRMLSVADLGAINRPQGFVSRISTQINGIFDTVLFPILSSIKDDAEKIGRAYIKIVSLVTTFSLILAISLSLSAPLIIDVFFGPQWIHLQPILIIFSSALIIHGYSRIADSFFRSLGIVRTYFLARLINWIVFISSVWIGCHYGIIGASIGMVSGSCLSCIVKYFMQKKNIGVRTTVLLKSVFENVTFIMVLSICSVCIMQYFNAKYIGILFFSMSIITSMIFFPGLYGRVFQEIVIHRYLKKFRKFRLY